VKEEKTPAHAAETLVFCEKSTGAPRFEVQITGDKEAAFSRAASLLALGCMVRGNSPADYAVWVPADSSLTDRIKKHADELLHVGRTLSCSIDLSPREGEVLKELLHHRLNKEIADRLRISVRTVKFHVSSLLAKFGVGSRWDLIQKAQPMFKNAQLAENFAAVQVTEHSSQAPAAQTVSAQGISAEALSHAMAKEHKQQKAANDRILPFRGHLRPA
jgi:DNA-binding CsgD family transcriptional regulator